MDNVNYGARFVRHVVESGALRDDPFVVIDIGCGMGIDEIWRLFEPYLHVHGFDAQRDEVDRLSRVAQNADVRYHAKLVGLPDDDPYHARARTVGGTADYYEPILRSSGYAASARERERGRDSLSELNSWPEHQLSNEKVTLSGFVRDEGLTNVDFVKTDTDGSDYEVLLSGEEAIQEATVLGFMIETPYNSAPDRDGHGFHSVDSFLRSRGFLLYTMSINRYSRAVLPAPFAFKVLAQTTAGQVMWGDLTYFRDGGSPNYSDVFGSDLSPTKLLKLACLYELFTVPDCAVELLLRHEQVLAPLIDVRHSLDLLTPPLNGVEVSYDEYVAAFERDPYAFYPRDHRVVQDVVAAATRDVGSSLGGVVQGAFGRLRGR